VNMSLSAGAGSGRIDLDVGLDVFGRRRTVGARIEAIDGRIEIGPNVPLLGNLLHITLFAPPQFSVDEVDVRSLRYGYELDARGHYL